MRDFLLLYVNGARHEIRGARAFLTLSDFLRRDLAATGTKIVCEEGDCGACSVLVGRVEGDRLAYRPVNSCILHLYQLDLAHVVTVEGLTPAEGLSAVQESMVAHHGAQCGFCTPGFVVAIAALFEGRDELTEREVREGLVGNLCRCTGYQPIARAALAVDPAALPRLDDLYPPAPLLAALAEVAALGVEISVGSRELRCPATLGAAVEFRASHPGATIVQGGTDVGVWVNKRGFEPEAVLTLGGVAELAAIEARDGELAVGGAVTLAQLERSASELAPELHRILTRFGSPQIRAVATLAGNLANASPIADTLPYLFVMGARVELAGPAGRREVAIGSLYTGYKRLAMAPEELISRVFLPLPAEGETVRLYKVSKRRDLDISSFTAAIRATLEGETIRSIRIAYGGVGPVVVRLPRTEAYLAGRALSEAAFVEAGRVARDEIAPISDVRGTRDYRLELAGGILVKFYHECAGEEVFA